MQKKNTGGRLHGLTWFDMVAAPMLAAQYQFETVSLLNLGAGDVVVDVACGTGSNFPQIERAIGPTGRLIGVDLSQAMLRQAHSRILSFGWDNVTLINAAAEEAQIGETVDAFLFSFAHDVLQSSGALRNLFQNAEQGASVAACGIKWAPCWNITLNFLALRISQQYHTIHEGLSKPWKHLNVFSMDLEVRQKAFETIYVAHGTVPGDGSALNN